MGWHAYPTTTRALIRSAVAVLLLMLMAATSCGAAVAPETATAVETSGTVGIAAGETEPVRAGRAALAEVEADAHILWFWGAH